MPRKKRRPGGSGRRGEFKVPGFKASGVSCGIKKKRGARDLALIASDVDARVAGVFTRNAVKAAPVLIDMKRVRKGVSRGVVVNSGNANACTGEQGHKDALVVAGLVEKALDAPRSSMMVSSTGVIGVPLEVEKIASAMPALVGALDYEGFEDAAEAMMTTDSFAKTALSRARVGGKTVTIGGVAKGAGMICPDMATMLAFLMTDADISQAALERSLASAVELSFNRIVVDNDTSTNDTVLVFANGVSDCAEIKINTPAYKTFSILMNYVCLKLAHMIVRDGEGATRFVEINVRGAASEAAALKAARTIAESYLVKTALYGGDPNWGRIMAALGRSGVKMKQERVRISLNGVTVVKDGLDAGNEARAARALKAPEIVVRVDLSLGRFSSKVWTSDLTKDYVKINSSYRT